MEKQPVQPCLLTVLSVTESSFVMKQGEVVRLGAEIPWRLRERDSDKSHSFTAVSMVGLQLQLAMESSMKVFGSGEHTEMSSFWQSPWLAMGHAHCSCNTPFLVLLGPIKTCTLSI